MKGKYFRDETSAGHQSRVLRGVDQADDVDAAMDEEAVNRVVLVGAVSRGIIDKRHRHDPSVYQSCFSPNPFDRITDDDLKQYKRKIMGLPGDEDDSQRDESVTAGKEEGDREMGGADRMNIVVAGPSVVETIIMPTVEKTAMAAPPSHSEGEIGFSVGCCMRVECSWNGCIATHAY